LLSLYVLEQDRNILLDPHIVVALKEGKIVNTNTVELCEEKKEEVTSTPQSLIPSSSVPTTITTEIPRNPVDTNSRITDAQRVRDANFPVLKKMLDKRLNKTSPPIPQLAKPEDRLEIYTKYKLQQMKAKDPVYLEECDDCYLLPRCEHGICGESLYHYAWNGVKEMKESVIRCPQTSQDKTENAEICGKVIPFAVVKKYCRITLRPKNKHPI